jgi:hypothetical protein
MVIAHILGQQPPEVLLIQDDLVVEQVSSATSDPALRHTVLPRTAKGSAGGWLPKPLTAEITSVPNFESRSNKRNLCAGTSDGGWRRGRNLNEFLALLLLIPEVEIVELSELTRTFNCFWSGGGSPDSSRRYSANFPKPTSVASTEGDTSLRFGRKCPD